jgi:peptidyl-prolyl cis-trans isomerase SurA
MKRPEFLSRRARAGLVALAVMALASPASAELIKLADAVRAPVELGTGNPFAARLYVNDLVITEYDLIQRAVFFKALRAPGDPVVEALKALIDDRLKMVEARRLGIKLTSEQLIAGMTEFAARANLTPEQFLQALAQEGIDQAAFEDFVRSGLLWRDVVRARFGGAVPAPENDIDRALNSIARQPQTRVQVEYAELLLADNAEEIARIKMSVDRCFDLYTAAKGVPAQQLNIYTRPIGEIPQDVAGELSRLDPGEISTNLARGGARVLLMLCNRSPIADPPPERAQIREQVIGLKAEGLAESYLEELRAAALIRTP